MPYGAHDDPTALQEAAAQSPGVVLLDIGLSGMHGWDVVSRLPKQPETKMALLMAMSGYGSSRDQINLRNVEVQRGRVRLGISAPDRVHILRAELFAADEAKRRLAQPVAGPAS